VGRSPPGGDRRKSKRTGWKSKLTRNGDGNTRAACRSLQKKKRGELKGGREVSLNKLATREGTLYFLGCYMRKGWDGPNPGRGGSGC